MRLVPVPVPVGPEQVRATLRSALQDPALPTTLLIHNDAAVAMLPFVLGDAADAVELLVEQGLLAAQQKFHAPRA